MIWGWTQLMIFGILVYGFFAASSKDISFNLMLVVSLFTMVFICECIANWMSVRVVRK